MTWVIVIISLTTGQVLSETPYGSAPPDAGPALTRQYELGCSKFSAIKAAEYNKEHPDQRIKAVCSKQ